MERRREDRRGLDPDRRKIAAVNAPMDLQCGQVERRGSRRSVLPGGRHDEILQCVLGLLSYDSVAEGGELLDAAHPVSPPILE